MQRYIHNNLKEYELGGLKLKSTGVVRKVDSQGRVVFPIELRRSLEIEEGTPLEIFTDGENIVLRKYKASCIFCGEAKNVINFKGKKVCKSCLNDIK